MDITVIIPTVGRARIVRRGIDRLSEQTRRPDRVMVIGTTQDDVMPPETGTEAADIRLTSKGLCKQRNLGLEITSMLSGVILFLDDDFVMAGNYLEELEKFFEEHPLCAGLTGNVLADGAHGEEISESSAQQLLISSSQIVGPAYLPKDTLYGCNMAFRLSMLTGMRFDENLPLYGWQEDIDFSYRLGAQHKLYKNFRMRGVHLGTRSGRSSGVRVGYSQIANPVYLLQKKGIPPSMARRLMMRNVLANLVGSLTSPSTVDRRGRLTGNARAIYDLLRGRSHPNRILNL